MENLDQQIKDCLGNEAMSYESYESLQAQLSSLPVVHSRTSDVEAVGRRLSFLQNYQAILNLPRIAIETIDQLLILCDDILYCSADKTDDNSHYALRSKLDTEVEASQIYLRSLVKESESIFQQANLSLQNG
jgi:ubiquinone biosynthesis protein COQ9